MAVEALLVLHCDGQAPTDEALLYTILYRRVIEALRRESVIVRGDDGEMFQPERSLDALEPEQRDNLIEMMAPQIVGGAPAPEPRLSTARARAIKALRVCSPRELEVLRLAASGLTSRETATEQSVSVETVKAQRANVLRALGARNMAHAVTLAFRRGMLA